MFSRNKPIGGQMKEKSGYNGKVTNEPIEGMPLRHWSELKPAFIKIKDIAIRKDTILSVQKFSIENNYRIMLGFSQAVVIEGSPYKGDILCFNTEQERDAEFDRIMQELEY